MSINQMSRLSLSPAAIVLLLAVQAGCGHSSNLKPPVATAPDAPLTLAAGATLTLMTAQAVDLRAAHPGDTFAVVVSRDTADSAGQTLLPSGSPATLIVAPGTSSGALELRLASVTLNGDSWLVSNENPPGAPGATLGTFLGGVAGTNLFMPAGQKPAGPPQLSAAAEIRCPTGSLLAFRLDRPVVLIGSHR